MSAKIAEVHPGIYEIFLPLPMRPTIINVYLVDCHGAWTLIDTGMNTADSIATLEDAFRQVGTKVEDLHTLIGTHHHVDHFGSSITLKKRSGARAYLHQLESERINRILTFGPPSSRPDAVEFFRTNGFPIDKHPPEGMRPVWFGTEMYSPLEKPDKYLNDGDQITVGDRTFEIIWTPGHAPGHCVVYLRKEKVLIVGDHLLPKITPHVGLYPSAPTGNPLGDFINSQVKVQRFDVELVLPAHGGVFQDHRHRSNQLIEHHRYREAEMLDLVRRKPKCAFDVASQVFGDEDRPIVHVMAATFETLAHLEMARIEGRAKLVQRDGLNLYQAV
ncbi:MAG TPA: MBL fold metallo-hydrolase [Candidatus Binataceae bacterium]|nr:MBL fold metallo-hydrolase [Candidatus Binataceae bacterium]